MKEKPICDAGIPHTSDFVRIRLRRGVCALCTSGIALLASACSTTLGYVPEMVEPDGSTVPPTYGEVRKWADEVADGYDSRNTLNRYAIYGGALTAAAGVGAMAGLAAFAPGSSALIGIPIGTTFLSGTMAIYNSEPKAIIYDYGSRAVKDLVALNDCRCGAACRTANSDQPDTDAQAHAAICLRRDVDRVMRNVSKLISYMDPKNVTDTLKAVATSEAALKAKSDEAEANLKKLTEELATAETNLSAAKTAAGKKAGDKKLQDAEAAAQATVTELQTKKTEAERIKKAALEAAIAAEGRLTQTLDEALAAPSTLETVRSTCEVPSSCLARSESLVPAP